MPLSFQDTSYDDGDDKDDGKEKKGYLKKKHYMRINASLLNVVILFILTNNLTKATPLL